MLLQADQEPKLDFEIHYVFSVGPFDIFKSLYILQMEHFVCLTPGFLFLTLLSLPPRLPHFPEVSSTCFHEEIFSKKEKRLV